MSPDQGQSKMALWIILGCAAAVVVLTVLVVLGAVAIYLLSARVASQRGSGLGPEFDYGIEKLQVIDPKLIAYEETRAVELKLQEPRGIALGPDGRLYVAGDRKIVIGGKGADELQLDDAPRALAVAADGTLYVAMADHVEVYSPKGERKASWESLGEKAMLTAIAVAEEDVFAADAGNREVVRYDLRGKLVGRIGRKDPERNVPGLIVPSPYLDLAVGREGLLWVANPGRRRIELYTFDGDLELWWGKSGVSVEKFGGCCNPSHFAIFPDGRVVTSEKGTVRVKVYDGDGTFRSVVGAAPDAFDEGALGLDVSVDSQGRIFVLDPGSRLVRVFTRKAKDERDTF